MSTVTTISEVKGAMIERRKQARKEMDDFRTLQSARIAAGAKKVGLKLMYEPAGAGGRERWTFVREHVVSPDQELYGSTHIDLIEAWLRGYSRCLLDQGRVTRE